MTEAATSISSWKGVQAVPYRSLRSSFAWAFAGNAVYSACQWAMLILLAKLGSPSLVGQYALGFAIVTPIIFFCDLQLRQVVASDVREDYQFSEYLGFRILSASLGLVLVAAVSLILHYEPSTTWLIVLIGCAQIVEDLSDILYARLQCLDRMDQIARSQIVRGPLSLLALLGGLRLTGSVAWGIFGVFLARGSVFLLYDIRVQLDSFRSRESFRSNLRWPQQLRPGIALDRLARLIVFALPLGVVALLVNLSTNVPRYFIAHSLGRSELGIFSALAFLVSIGNLFAGALAQATFARMAAQFNSGHLCEFRRLLYRMVGIGTALGLAGILVAQFAGARLISILYRPEYARQPQLLVGLMVVAWLGYLGQFLGYAMTAARNFRSQIPIFALTVLAITAGSYLLIPRFALAGAVFSLFLGAVIQLAGSIAVLVFAMRRRQTALTAEMAGGAL